MYTQCPKCRTIFAIDEDALQASLGIVRCGHCAERFDALLTLSDRLPSDPEAPLPERGPDALAPTLTDSVAAIGAMAADGHAGAVVQGAAVEDPTSAHAVESVITRPDDEWVASLSGTRTQALIADAAGIPAEALQGDSAWQVVELPVQSGDIELDAIPLVPAADAQSANDAVGVKSTSFVEVVESEPFTGPWTVDIPLTVKQVADPSGQSNAPADTLPAAPDATATGDTLMDGKPPLAAVNLPSPAMLLSSAETAPNDMSATDDAPALEPDAAMTVTDTDIAADVTPETESSEAKPTPLGPAEPVYVPPRRRHIRRSEWLWALGCLVLALGLAAQVAWANRVSLVLDPATQNLTLHACTRIACHLPPIRDTAKLELLSRDIRPDPKAAHALAITATFRNNASFWQPWPVVVVRLTDLDNNPVAMRRFRPAEYLPDPRHRAAGIAPGTTAAVAFKVADPGQRAVSFNFGFE